MPRHGALPEGVPSARGAAALLLTVGLLVAPAALQAAPKPPKVPAEIEITVEPARAGERAEVVLALRPVDGVKINRYPQIKLQLPESAGLVAAAEAVMGDATPPPVERMGSNYFESLEPLRLALDVDVSASAGSHALEARLSYFYCMPASGFCAPVRVPVTIPLRVQ